MSRVTKQLQLGAHVEQVEAIDFEPNFDNKDMFARLVLEDIGGGTLRPSLILLSEDVWSITTRARFSSYFWDIRARGTTTSELVAGCIADGDGATFFLNYWNGSSWETALHTDSGNATPYMRLSELALVLGDGKLAAAANINPGQGSLAWDDTPKRLKARDSDGDDYSLGFNDRGDPSSYDFTEADLTEDGTWRDLDLSSIAPAGTKAVVLHVVLDASTAGDQIMFRKNGNSNAINVGKIQTEVGGQVIEADMTIPCDSSQVIEYNATSGIAVDIVVKGWFI